MTIWKSPNAIIKILKDISEWHKDINDFGWGKTDLIGDMKHPYLWTDIISTNIIQGDNNWRTVEYNVDIYLRDRRNRFLGGEGNGELEWSGNDIISDQTTTLLEIIQLIAKHPLYNNLNIEISGDLSVESEYNVGDGEENGIKTTLTIRSVYDSGYCAAPWNISPTQSIWIGTEPKYNFCELVSNCDFIKVIEDDIDYLMNNIISTASICGLVSDCDFIKIIEDDIDDITTDVNLLMSLTGSYMPLYGTDLMGSTFSLINTNILLGSPYYTNLTIDNGIQIYSDSDTVQLATGAFNQIILSGTGGIIIEELNTSVDINTINLNINGNVNINNSNHIISSSYRSSGYGLSFINNIDLDTGIHFNGPDTLSLTTGNVDRLLVNSAGNVGIGTTTPAYRLDVNGSTRLDGTLIQKEVVATASATQDIDVSTSNNFEYTINTGTTFTLTNFVNGQTVNIVLNNTGAHAITFTNTIKWKGTAPTFTQNGIDVLTLLRINNVIYGSVIQNFI
jgi:hypothetical protein